QRALAAGGAPGATAPPGTSATAMGADQRGRVRWLVAAAVLEAAVATALDFRFGAAMKARFTGDDLVTAVSLFYGGSHLLLLALQVTLVPRLLTSRALPVTVSIHPLAAAVGAGALALVPGFGAIAFVRTGEWVLRAATSRTGQELSLSALPPVPRARWKVLLRGAATPLGAALAGGVLYLTSARAVTEPVAFAAILAGVILVWLVVVRRAARSFLAAMAAPLGMRGVALRGRQHTAFDLDAWIRLVAATGLPEPRAAELARAAMARSGGAADEITPYLADEDPAVRRALYELAARRPRPAAVRELHVAAQIEDDPEALAAALDALAADGSKRWELRVGGDLDAAPAVGEDGTIYIGSDDDALHAVNPDGSVRWKLVTGGDVRGPAAIAPDGTIYVGSYDKHLYAVAPSGQIKWRLATADKIHGAPVVATNGVVLIGSQDDHLYAVDPAGVLLWYVRTGGDLDAPPAIGPDGTIYLVGDDGILRALR
ncbi:MAG: PQQ-like beta-propeller repeat protein, partial [Kofleriaceae bacterium]|nr:PQQ-like beta-propeller repeat protein [Kofleriaceae bacterium]